MTTTVTVTCLAINGVDNPDPTDPASRLTVSDHTPLRTERQAGQLAHHERVTLSIRGVTCEVSAANLEDALRRCTRPR